MTKLTKYPSIEQFRNVIRSVKDHTYYNGKDSEGNVIYDYTKPLPTITFTGKVKLHGTNSAVVYDLSSGGYWCQSRERIITPLTDNAGFATYVKYHEKEFFELRNTVTDYLYSRCTEFDDSAYESVAIYGEWAGSGIQKGVAIAQLPKMFVVFGIKLVHKDDDGINIWLSDDARNDIITSDEELRLFNINDFKQYPIDIDFNNPEQAQHLITQWVDEVEQECPVGKHFGVDGIGEGIVFSATIGTEVLRFKCKGSKHSASKVKTLASVDIEKVNTIKELCDQIMTENRMQQGLTWMSENNHQVDVKNTGVFLKWAVGDCLKEELDTIIGSGLEVKDVTPKLSAVARAWFFAELNKQAGI